MFAGKYEIQEFKYNNLFNTASEHSLNLNLKEAHYDLEENELYSIHNLHRFKYRFWKKIILKMPIQLILLL